MDNRDRIDEFMSEYRKSLLEKADAIRNNMERERLLRQKEAGEYSGEIPEEVDVEFDEFEFHFRLFCALTEGPHDKLNMRKFNIKVTQKAQDDFLSDAQKTANSLMSFSLLSANAARKNG